jgi:hypothetical protein
LGEQPTLGLTASRRAPPTHTWHNAGMPDWRQLPPENLIMDPTLISVPDERRADEAMQYARSAGECSYDDLGFRIYAASPVRGESPLQTIPGMRRDRLNEEATRPSSARAEAMEQEALLSHRPIEAPEGRFRYTLSGNLIHLRRKRPGARVSSDEETWTFPLTAPPQMMLSACVPRDEPLLAAQQLEVPLPGVFWIPLSLPIEAGRLPAMQQWRDRLVEQTAPRNFYCFVSHRWLTPTHPDPEGVQAALIVWQIVAHLCEAVRVASRRGLCEPRKFFPGITVALGIRGSDLAEALIVNVLRFGLDTELLTAAAAEVVAMQDLRDYGVGAAARDRGLEQLRSSLESAPVLSALIERIFIWYDFSSMPQAPRAPDDETLFREGLKYLNAIQVMGRTAILLDEAEDYLSRGWCTLESVAADTFGGLTDLLVGSKRTTAATGRVERYFELLLEDRPHLIWRAVLDTELFRLQTPEECLSRLNLAVTDPNDIPFIYEGLIRLGAPRKIHINPSELVSGVFPLPAVDGKVMIPRASDRVVSLDEPQYVGVNDLDWTKAFSLSKQNGSGELVPAWMQCAAAGAGKKSCHVALSASCEGEAVLVAGWIRDHLQELENIIDTTVISVSWLASDIAPVGSMAEGRLRSVAVTADVWVLVAAEARIDHCNTTACLQNAIRASRLPYFELRIDERKGNLGKVRYPETHSIASQASQSDEETFRAVTVEHFRPLNIPGGVFRAELLELLAGQERRQ